MSDDLPRPSRVRRAAAAVLAGLAHGLLMALAFPPWSYWGLCLVAILPLLWIALRPRSWPVRERALGVLVGAAPLWFYQCSWVIDISAFGYVPMAIALAAFPSAAVAILARVSRGVPFSIVAALLWTALEVLRGEVIVTGYAWLLLGHPLIDTAIGPAIASSLGAYAASFIAALVSGLIAEARWVRGGDDTVLRGLKIAALPLMIAGATLLWSGSRGPKAPPGGAPPPMRVAVVQTNVPQDNKSEWTAEQRRADFARMLELTRQASRLSPPPDLIVWPETMFPGDFLQPIDRSAFEPGAGPWTPPMTQELLDTSAELRLPIMVGALGAEALRVEPSDDGRARLALDARFNSVFLLEAGRLQGTRYDKMELTPFGETMPYVRHWPWLQRQVLGVAARGMAFDLSEGARPEVFTLGAPGGARVAIATPICFEITKSSHVRRLSAAARGTPLVVVNLSNDGWFGGFDPGRAQHFQIARWRAAELGVPVVRAVNTGISGFIDVGGRVVRGAAAGPAGIGVDGVVVAEITPRPATTLLARTGNVFGWLCVAGAALALVVAWRRGRKDRPAGDLADTPAPGPSGVQSP